MAIKSIAATAAFIKTVRSASVMATTNIRFITDIDAELDHIDEVLLVMRRRLAQQREAVKSAIFEVDTSDIKTSPVTKVSTEFTAKSIKALREQTSLMEQLRTTLDTLDTLSARLKAQFPEDGPQVRATMTHMARTRETIIKQLNEAYAANNELAKARIPAAFLSQIELLAGILSRAISYEASESFVHIFEAESTGNICMSHYFYLKQCVADDGEAVPQLFVVLTYDAIAKVYYLNTSRTFDHPSEANNMIKQVRDARSIATALRVLLDIDSFANSIGDVPITLLVAPGQIRRELFSAHSYVSKFEVDETTGGFIFHLKPTVRDREDAQRIQNQLYLDIKGLQRKTTATLKPRLAQVKGRWRVSFTLNTASARLRATPDDLSFLKTQYHLDDADVSRVLRIINNQ